MSLSEPTASLHNDLAQSIRLSPRQTHLKNPGPPQTLARLTHCLHPSDFTTIRAGCVAAAGAGERRQGLGSVSSSCEQLNQPNRSAPKRYSLFAFITKLPQFTWQKSLNSVVSKSLGEHDAKPAKHPAAQYMRSTATRSDCGTTRMWPSG